MTDNTVNSIKDYIQPQFFISTFMAFDNSGDRTKYEKVAQLSKDAGINLIETAWISRSAGEAAAAACEAVGIKFILQDGLGEDKSVSGFQGSILPAANEEDARSTAEKFSEYKYLEGFYVWDEVEPPQFTRCKELCGYFNRYAEGKLAYSLVLPSYGNYQWDKENPDKSAYCKYVTDYINEADPAVICVDYYPFIIHGGDKAKLTDCGMWRDMGLMRKKSIETGKPFWFYFQAYNMIDKGEGYTFTNEMRSAQMYSALAYGVKCLSYYTSSACLTDSMGNKLPDYGEIKALNLRVQNIGDLLFNAESRELYHFGIRSSNQDNFYLDDVESSALISSAPKNTIVGVFAEGEKQYIIVASKDFKKAISGTLELKAEVELSSFDPETATFSPIGKVKSTALELPAGGCAVFAVE